MIYAIVIAVLAAGNTATIAPTPAWKLSSRPESAVEIVLQEQKGLDADGIKFTRYVWCKRNSTVCLAVAGALNIGPSRASTTVAPRSIADGELLAVDLRTLATNERDLAEVCRLWEKLATGEPFFHQTIYDVVPSAPWTAKDGKVYRTKRQARTVPAYEGLFCGQLIEGGWFVKQCVSTLTAAGATGLYYDFIDVVPNKTTLKEVLKRNHADNVDEDSKAKAVLISNVTEKPRSVQLFHSQETNPAIGPSYVAITEDPSDEDEANPQFDAEQTLVDLQSTGKEVFIRRKNGWLLFLAVQSKTDLILSEVPSSIASAGPGLAKKARLQPAISCITCHIESGWRPARDAVAALLKTRTDIFDPHNAALIAANHQASLDTPFELARSTDMKLAIRAGSDFLQGPSKDAAVEMYAAMASTFQQAALDRVNVFKACLQLGVDFGKPLDGDEEKQRQADAISMLHELLPVIAPKPSEFAPEETVFAYLKSGEEVTTTQWFAKLPYAMQRSNAAWLRMKAEQDEREKVKAERP